MGKQETSPEQKYTGITILAVTSQQRKENEVHTHTKTE